MSCAVYWIRREGHKDIFFEGYVGITTNTTRRWKQHLHQQHDNPHLRHALAAYTDIVFEVVYTGTQADAQDIERYFRPNRIMGWNIAPGGNLPPPQHGREMSESSRAKYKSTIAERNSNYRSPDQRTKMYATRKANGFRPEHNLNVGVARNTQWWNDGVSSKRSVGCPGLNWVRGRLKFRSYGADKECPHCGLTGRGSGMTRFHFNNCKHRKHT